MDNETVRVFETNEHREIVADLWFIVRRIRDIKPRVGKYSQGALSDVQSAMGRLAGALGSLAMNEGEIRKIYRESQEESK